VIENEIGTNAAVVAAVATKSELVVARTNLMVMIEKKIASVKNFEMEVEKMMKTMIVAK